nr:hypothetical protein CFP56_45876 [Quercus suber]
MNALDSPGPAPVQVQHLIASVKSWTPKFSAWNSSFTCREGNTTAHLLARNAKEISDYTVLVEDTCNCLSNPLRCKCFGSQPSLMKAYQSTRSLSYFL